MTAPITAEGADECARLRTEAADLATALRGLLARCPDPCRREPCRAAREALRRYDARQTENGGTDNAET